MKYLQIDEHGNILSVAQPTMGFTYTPREDTKEVPNEVKINYETSWWNIDLNMLDTRDPRPGEFYKWENGNWVFVLEDFLNVLRYERNLKLSGTDWALMVDSPLAEEEKSLYRVYRQSLRDLTNYIPEDITSLDDVDWPEAP